MFTVKCSVCGNMINIDENMEFVYSWDKKFEIAIEPTVRESIKFICKCGNKVEYGKCDEYE